MEIISHQIRNRLENWNNYCFRHYINSNTNCPQDYPTFASNSDKQICMKMPYDKNLCSNFKKHAKIKTLLGWPLYKSCLWVLLNIQTLQINSFQVALTLGTCVRKASMYVQWHPVHSQNFLYLVERYIVWMESSILHLRATPSTRLYRRSTLSLFQPALCSIGTHFNISAMRLCIC